MDHLLATHNIVRWFVLLFGLYALTKSARGLMKQQDYTKKHKTAYTLFLASLHLQGLMGLVLYFANDWHSNLSNAFADMGNSYLRFFAIEHIFGMLFAIVLIQIGSVKLKKMQDARRKHKLSLRYIIISFVVILASIPWKFREYPIGRDWWPTF